MTFQKRSYAIDGWHGGFWGHMPLGAWRDILNCLKEHPEWKISLDIEPLSWDELQQRDPAAYEEMLGYLREDSGRVEIVAPTYAQPYPWLTDGESLIRHLTYGHGVIRRHFPWLRIETYAVQEPCWTSAMPQILISMGYQRAVLKNPSTAWAGYCAGWDAEIGYWVGPDGTRIPAVPRYAFEKLIATWQSEACDIQPEFLEKCARAGIAHPASMWFQDLGWMAIPYLENQWLMGQAAFATRQREGAVYTTWREYFEKYADKPQKEWHMTQEALLVALPWGDQQLSHMARQVRKGENALLTAQKMDALCAAWTGCASGRAALDDAAVHLMLSQHHDGWICASTGENEGSWAWRSCAHIFALEQSLRDNNRRAMGELARGAATPARRDDGRETYLIYHLLLRAENAYAALPVTCPPGTQAIRALCHGQPLESQLLIERRYPDESVCAGTLLVYAPFGGVGATAIDVCPLFMKTPDLPMPAQVDADWATLESDLYAIRFDLARGGGIVSFINKQTGRETASSWEGTLFNGFRGSFADGFHSSAEHRAQARVAQSGSLETVLEIKGQVGCAAFTQTVALRMHDPVVHVQVDFDFPPDTQIGDPFQIPDTPPERPALERHRSYHDGRYKLNACFPTAFAQEKVYKDAAFDVCQSAQENTYFQRWDEIKHNVLLSFVAVSDGVQGLSVFSEAVTSYVQGADHPLGLTLAWAGDGGYWWRHRTLKGRHTVAYGIMPFTGDWRQGDLWHESQKLQLPPIPSRLGGEAPEAEEPYLLRSPESHRVELSWAGMDEENRLLLRLFNPGNEAVIRLELPDRLAGSAEMIELDGRAISPLDPAPDEKCAYELKVPAFALRTLRIKKADELS